MARRGKPYWLCKCGTRNLKKFTYCQSESCNRTKPKKRVTKHAEVLRDTPYEEWAVFSQSVHGGQLHHCGVCGKAPTKVRRLDRDHDHDTGKARGLACPGLKGCNLLMPSWLTAKRAQQIADYLARVEAHYQSSQGDHQTEGESDDTDSGSTDSPGG